VVNTLFQDARFGLRTLRKNPGFSLAAIITLALGIGANTSIFTITSAVLLKPLPFHDPQQLISIDTQQKDGQSRCCSLNWTDLLREHSRSFSSISVSAPDNLTLTGRGEPLEVAAGRVSPGFFETLGVTPQLGRTFTDDEGRTEGKPVIMLSDTLWQTRFGGDRTIIGQTLTLDSTPYTVVGVLPAGVQFPFVGSPDVWTPRYFEHSLFTPQRLRMGVGYLTPVARLRPGVSREQAKAEIELLYQQYRKESPAAPDADPGLSVIVTYLQESLVANIRGALLIISFAVGAVLLIACGNVAGLLLSRALARRKEIAVRTALGARRFVVIRQLLTESMLLAVIAGFVGLGLSLVTTRSLAAFAGSNLPQGTHLAMDARVLFFTLAISALTGVIFGIFPALQLSRTNVNATLRDEGRGASGGRSRAQLTSVLVVAQVAVTMALLVIAGLLVRSFGKLLRVDPGFDPENVLTMNISLPTVKYNAAQKQISFFDELLRRVSALPGVRSAAVSAALPVIPKRITPVLPEGQPEVPLAERPFIIIEATSPSLLETLHIPRLAGRGFTDADTADAPKVIIVNRALARRYWPNENAVGKHILIGRMPTPSEIIGVAGDTKNSGLAEDTKPLIYLPFQQLPWGNMNLIVRTGSDPRGFISAIRAQVASLDPDQPVTAVQTVDELMDTSRAQPKFTMLLIAMFSAAALVLAAIGIYGVLAYTVAQRQQELGVRLALGAEKSDIFRLVVGQGLTLTLIGVGLGLMGALVASSIAAHAVAGLFYKVHAWDLTTFVLTPLAFLLIAFAASYFPALRATHVQPTEALRGSGS
jgi:putative ABC transport system permease protein